jgi:hypothetical protein
MMRKTFIENDDVAHCAKHEIDARQISAARCARVSYLSFDTGKRSTVEEDAVLFKKLAGSTPKHLSPLEHPAMATNR